MHSVAIPNLLQRQFTTTGATAPGVADIICSHLQSPCLRRAVELSHHSFDYGLVLPTNGPPGITR